MELDAKQLQEASVEDLVTAIRTASSDGRLEGPKGQLQVRLIESLTTAIDKLVASNVKASDANDKYARHMTGLTWALAIATFVQAGASIISLFNI